MCYSKIVRNSHSSVEQFQLSSCVITACLRVLHSVCQWCSSFSLKRAKSRFMILRESGTKKILAQVNSHVLFYCWMKRFYCWTNIWEVLWHRRSHGGPMGPFSPLTLEHIVVLCFERQYPKQNSANSLAPQFLGCSPLTTSAIIAEISKLTAFRRHYEATTSDQVHQKNRPCLKKSQNNWDSSPMICRFHI